MQETLGRCTHHRQLGDDGSAPATELDVMSTDSACAGRSPDYQSPCNWATLRWWAGSVPVQAISPTEKKEKPGAPSAVSGSTVLVCAGFGNWGNCVVHCTLR